MRSSALAAALPAAASSAPYPLRPAQAHTQEQGQQSGVGKLGRLSGGSRHEFLGALGWLEVSATHLFGSPALKTHAAHCCVQILAPKFIPPAPNDLTT